MTFTCRLSEFTPTLHLSAPDFAPLPNFRTISQYDPCVIYKGNNFSNVTSFTKKKERKEEILQTVDNTFTMILHLNTHARESADPAARFSVTDFQYDLFSPPVQCVSRVVYPSRSTLTAALTEARLTVICYVILQAS